VDGFYFSQLMKNDHPCGELVTKIEVAELLHVTPRTIETWVAQGKIPAIRLSARCIRFDAADVLRRVREKFSTTPA